MINQFLLLALTAIVMLNPQLSSAENLKYIAKTKQGVISILKDLNLKPIYGSNGYLKQTLDLNPKIAATPQNHIQINQVVVLPISELSGTDKFKNAEPGFVERTEKPSTPEIKESPTVPEVVSTTQVLQTPKSQSTEINTETSQSEILAKEILKEGTYKVGGSFDFSSTVTTTYDVNVDLGYFITDNLSVDGRVGVSSAASGTAASLGAGVSYYFFKFARWAPYVSQMLGATAATGTTVSAWGNTNLGIKYFLTPRIAFTTAAQTSYALSDLSQQSLVVVGGFSLFL